MQDGIKYDIDTITSVVDTRYCNEKLLPLLQSKLGFFTHKHLTTTELRTVLTSFRDIIQDKGSAKGIREAIELYLKVIGASRDSRITIRNSSSSDFQLTDSYFNNSYIVEVAIEGQITDLTLLTELLKYVLPAGYKLKYSFYSALDTIDYIVEKGTINIIIVSSAVNNRVASQDAEFFTESIIKYIFAEGIVSENGIYYIKNGNSYEDENVTYDSIIQDTLATELAASFTPVVKGTPIFKSVFKDGLPASGKGTLYVLVDAEDADTTSVILEGTSHIAKLVKRGDTYYAAKTYVIETEVELNVQHITDIEAYIEPQCPNPDDDINVNYYKGPGLQNKQTLSVLFDEGVVAYLFTEAAVNNIYVDDSSIRQKRSVKAGEQHNSMEDYYWYQDQGGSQELVKVENWYALTVDGYVECTWIVERNELIYKEPEEIYYTAVDEYYIFKKGQQIYYVASNDILANPSAISTSSVARRDADYTYIPTDDKDDEYKFRLNPKTIEE
jgi:hypothetical protein